MERALDGEASRFESLQGVKREQKVFDRPSTGTSASPSSSLSRGSEKRRVRAALPASTGQRPSFSITATISSEPFVRLERNAARPSATIPLAMAAAAEQGRLRPGMRVLLAVASAGISTGLSRFTYLT